LKSLLELIPDAINLQSGVCFENFTRSALVNLVQTADDDVRALFYPSVAPFGFDRVTIAESGSLARDYALYIISGLEAAPDMASLVRNKSYDRVRDFMTRYNDTIGREIYRLYLHNNLCQDSQEGYGALAQSLATTNYEVVTKLVSEWRSPAPAQLILAALRIVSPHHWLEVETAWGASDVFRKTFADIGLKLQLDNYPWLNRYYADVLSDELKPGITVAAKNNKEAVKQWLERWAI
jgi:hypothetical protein